MNRYAHLHAELAYAFLMSAIAYLFMQVAYLLEEIDGFAAKAISVTAEKGGSL